MITKVKLRQKSISKGRKSLYLDFYPPIPIKGKKNETTRRQFLNLFIPIKPKNPLEKQDKKQTLILAEQIRQKRDNEINKPEVYTDFELEKIEAKKKGEISFTKYFQDQMEKKNGKNYDVWLSSFEHFKEYSGGSVKFKNVDEKFCNNFKDYLLGAKSRRDKNKIIANNTALSYFNKFKATLKQAFKDNIIPFDLNSKINTIAEAETRREFLTLGELNDLNKTPCENKLLKQSSIYSALTGMAFKEIQNMVWKDITHTKEKGYSVLTRRQKTKRDNYLPIPDQAYELLGEPGEPNEKVFKGFEYSAQQNRELLKWSVAAGISKHITFHSFRHTYATLQLLAGTDLYTVSKMLGHKDLKTTQIYAKIVDETKRRATDKIKLD